MYKKAYDISVVLGAESIDYPGDTPFSKEVLLSIENSSDYSLSKLEMSAHSGTHIDAPAHFVSGGKTIDAYSVERFMLPAQVVAVRDRESICSADLEPCTFGVGDAVLFKTDNSLDGRCANGLFSDNYVYLSPDAAAFCVERKVALVGLDYVTIERYGAQSFTSHRRLLGNDIPVLEGITLEEVPEGRYTLMCLPLKIKGGEASPVRAVLFR